MNISKDEARILAAALEIAKFEFNVGDKIVFAKLEMLEAKLDTFGKDKRRTGRTSLDSFADLLKRFSTIYYEPSNLTPKP